VGWEMMGIARLVSALAAILMIGLVGTAWGTDLQLSIGGQAEYDPNVGRDKSDISSGVFRLVPKIHLIEDKGNLQYDATYTPYYQWTTSSAGAHGFQHYLTASAQYFIGDRAQISLSNNFSYAESVDTVNDVSAEGVPTVGTRDQPVSRNSLNIGGSYMFTPRLSGSLGAGWRLFSADLFNRADSNSYTANSGLSYILTSRHTIGAGVTVDYQAFQESQGGLRPAEETLFVNAYGGWTWTIDETTSFKFRVGPTFVDSDQELATTQTVPVFPLSGSDTSGGFGFDANNCPPAVPPPGGEFIGSCPLQPLLPGQFSAANAAGTVVVPVIDPFRNGSTSNWTWFGSAALNKRWRPDLVTSLTYRRTASTSSGLGSSVLDDLALLSTWDISELWSSAFRVDFTIRESTSPVKQYIPIVTNQSVAAPGTLCGAVSPTCLASFQGNPFRTALIDQDINTIRWGASVVVTRLISKRVQASLRYTFASQTSEADTLGLSSDFQDHLITLAVQYNFDRWKLW